MNLKTITAAVALALAFAWASCGEKKTITEENSETVGKAELHSETESNVVGLTPEQMSAIGLEMGAVAQKNITATIKVNGTLEVPAQNKAFVTSLYSEAGKIDSLEAMVTFERIEVARGTADLGFTEIIPVGDLPGSAKIVVKGAFYVLAKMTNRGGHDH